MSLGVSPVELNQWPASAFSSLQALYRVQPWGPERDNMHAAMLAAMYAGAHTKAGKSRPKMQDYMLKRRAPSNGAARLNAFVGYLRSSVKK